MTFVRGWEPTSQNQVIGESDADGAFIKAVAAAYRVPAFDYTCPRGRDDRPLGKDQFKTHLNGLQHFVTRRRVSSIVVVGDNDADHSHALATVRRAIKEAKNYPTPPHVPCKMAVGQEVSVGFLMIPGEGLNGCLETLLLKAALKGGPSIQCLDEWAKCAAFPLAHRNNYDKFRMRCILAASIHDEPNITLTRMWTKSTNPIDPHDPAFAWIGDFLNTAFS